MIRRYCVRRLASSKTGSADSRELKAERITVDERGNLILWGWGRVVRIIVAEHWYEALEIWPKEADENDI